MEKNGKHPQTRRAYGFFLLGAISQLGDSLFLYYGIFQSTRSANGGILSATLLGTDPCLQILLAPCLARLVEGVRSVSERLRLSAIVRALSAGLALMPVLFVGSSGAGAALLAAFIGLRLLALVDSLLLVDIRLVMSRSGWVDLTRSAALATLSVRGVHAVAPLLAVALGDGAWFLVCLLNSLSYGFGLVALISVRWPVEDATDPAQSAPGQCRRPEEARSRLGTWHAGNQFLLNLSFGSVALLLGHLGSPRWNTPLFQSVPPVSLVYGGMAIMLLVPLLVPGIRRRIDVCRLERGCQLALVLGALFVASSVLAPLASLVAFAVAGACYALCLLIGTNALLPMLDGPRLTRYLAVGQSAGRAGSVLSLASAGFLTDAGTSPFLLLAVCGGFGIISSWWLRLRLRACLARS